MQFLDSPVEVTAEHFMFAIIIVRNTAVVRFAPAVPFPGQGGRFRGGNHAKFLLPPSPFTLRNNGETCQSLLCV